ncbi:MAG: response regulator [Methanoregula sp.]|uniref:response regulator n=1 Tax=Methanoregula sp. TaxID=2052170 RepID=UPI003C752E7C
MIYVENDPDFSSLVCHLSHKYGISLHPLSSVKEALEWLTVTPADVIVSDYDMPEINGLEFLKILRAWGDLTPFILFSDAETIEELARAAALYGSVGLISKNRDLGKQINHLVNMIRMAIQVSSNRNR